MIRSGIFEQLRSEHRYNQIYIAEFLGISNSTYGNYERGKRQMPFHLVKKLADLYEVNLNFFLDENAPKKVGEPTISYERSGPLINFNGLEQEIKAIKDRLTALEQEKK